MEHRPGVLLNGVYVVCCLALPGAVAAAVLWSSWSWTVKGLLLGLIAVWIACSFPRHHLFYTLRTSAEGFDYVPWVGRERSVHWDDVTAYRVALFWVRLLGDDGRVRFIFERPLLVENRRRFLDELETQCPTAKRLGRTEMCRLFWRAMKESVRET